MPCSLLRRQDKNHNAAADAGINGRGLSLRFEEQYQERECSLGCGAAGKRALLASFDLPLTDPSLLLLRPNPPPHPHLPMRTRHSSLPRCCACRLYAGVVWGCFPEARFGMARLRMTGSVKICVMVQEAAATDLQRHLFVVEGSSGQCE